MHAIITSDGTHKQSEFLRVFFTLAYLLFATGGALLLLSPELHNIYEDSGAWMSGFIVAGGVLSMLGSATRRWVGEFIGNPLLAVGLAVLGFEQWITSHEAYPLIAGANLAVLLAVSTLLIVRWRRVLAVANFAHAVARFEKGGQTGATVG